MPLRITRSSLVHGLGCFCLVGAMFGAAGSAAAEEVVAQNDRVTGGSTTAIQAGFIAGESAVVWLDSPCNGTIVAVQVFWRSFGGGAQQTLEDAIYIREEGTYPVPGTILETLKGPVMTDGVLNEYRFLDDNQTIPIDVPVTNGQRFAIEFVFFNSPNQIFGPSLITDTNGCAGPGTNAVNAAGQGYIDVCALGISGDFVIRAVIDCPGEPGACCLLDGTCVSELSADCDDQEGLFQGEGTLCGDVQCPAPVGACCFSNPDSCSDLTEKFCGIAGGAWSGALTDCANFICNPEGACCLPDGSCLEAQPEADCINAGGVFQGDSVACGSVSCPQPIGACCLANDNCLPDLEPAQCNGIPNAVWLGADTECAECNPTDCPSDIAMDDSGPTCGSDGTVDTFDILQMLSEWQTAGTCADIASDENGPNNGDPDGVVDTFDLLKLLADWGDCE